MALQSPGYDLCLLDLGLPDLSGIEALVKFRAACPELPVVVLSGNADRASILAGLDAGAMGYIPKSSPVSVMINAIRLVMSGAVYVPAEALRARNDAPAECRGGAGARPASAPLRGASAAHQCLGCRTMPAFRTCRRSWACRRARPRSWNCCSRDFPTN